MTLTPQQLQEAVEFIKSHGHCGIVSHANPDADALGSSLGLAEILRENNIAAHVVNESDINQRYHFMKGATDIQKNFGDFQPACLIVLDCSDEKRPGDVLWPTISHIKPRLVIDHHRSHIKFGDITLLDSEESSTAAMVLDLVRASGWKISKAAATALYAGIVSDTGSFRYSSVRAKTFSDAAWLAEHGVRTSEVAELLYSRTRKEAMLLQAEAVRNAEFLFDGKCFFVALDAPDFQRFNAQADDAEGLAERGRDIEGVDVSISARFLDNVWRVSLRASKTNVAKVAEVFGGGGHMYAAAFRSKQPLEIFKPLLLAEVEKALKLSN